KTMGVTDLGSGTDELTQFLASKAGLTKNDYHTLAVGAGATAIAALQRHSADCVMTTQPTVGSLEAQKIAYSAVDLATENGAQKAQFLPDGIMPAGGPKVIFAMEKANGVDTSKVKVADTFTNEYAQAANKLEGTKVTSSPAGSDG